MDEYISKEATKAEFAKNFAYKENENFANWLERVANEIIDRVPAADVQPVVCCKDCKYAQNCTYFQSGTMSQNDFCSQGERRVDAK